MAKYRALKQERDEAVERMLVAERNSKLEELERLKAVHAEELRVQAAQFQSRIDNLAAQRDALARKVAKARTALAPDADSVSETIARVYDRQFAADVTTDAPKAAP